MDETLHGLIQDVEGGYVHSLAFVSPGRMAWPLPLYELALMTAGRAYDMGIELSVTIVTPEDAPLAIFGARSATRVASCSRRRASRPSAPPTRRSPTQGTLVINPGDRRLKVDRVVALPELYGPSIRGIPLGEHGFIRVDRHGRVPDVGPIYAAGDATSSRSSTGARLPAGRHRRGVDRGCWREQTVSRSRFTLWSTACFSPTANRSTSPRDHRRPGFSSEIATRPPGLRRARSPRSTSHRTCEFDREAAADAMTAQSRLQPAWSSAMTALTAREGGQLGREELLPDGKLVIVHACRPLHAPPSPLSTAAGAPRDGRAMIDELFLDGDEALFDIEVQAEISDHDPVTALTDAARRHGARAIVVGCEQHSRLHKALGTVTSELLKSSPVPVIAVPLNSHEQAA